MIKKFTSEEYDNTKSTGLLTFECEQCGSDFKRQRSAIGSELDIYIPSLKLAFEIALSFIY